MGYQPLHPGGHPHRVGQEGQSKFGTQWRRLARPRTQHTVLRHYIRRRLKPSRKGTFRIISTSTNRKTHWSCNEVTIVVYAIPSVLFIFNKYYIKQFKLTNTVGMNKFDLWLLSSGFSVPTIPVRAPLIVTNKLHVFPKTCKRFRRSDMKAAPEPEMTVLTTAWETASPSPLLLMVSCEPPLKARNPKNRMNPPKAAICNGKIINKHDVLNQIFTVSKITKLGYQTGKTTLKNNRNPSLCWRTLVCAFLIEHSTGILGSLTYRYGVTSDGGHCLWAAVKSADPWPQQQGSDQGSNPAQHMHHAAPSEVLCKETGGNTMYM